MLTTDNPQPAYHPQTPIPDVPQLQPYTPTNATNVTIEQEIAALSIKQQLSLTEDDVMKMRSNSSSRRNLAVNIMRKIFTEEERSSSNVRGTLGKKKLDPHKIAIIKDLTFRAWPLESKELNQMAAWKICVTAIDEANRRLNRKKQL